MGGIVLIPQHLGGLDLLIMLHIKEYFIGLEVSPDIVEHGHIIILLKQLLY